MIQQTIFHLAVALAVGFLIGVERGREKRESAEGSRVSGVRTCGLLGLLGGVVGLLSQQHGGMLLGLSFIGIAGALAAAHVVYVQRTPDVSITSLVAGLPDMNTAFRNSNSASLLLPGEGQGVEGMKQGFHLIETLTPSPLPVGEEVRDSSDDCIYSVCFDVSEGICVA